MLLALDTALPATQIALVDSASGRVHASQSLPMATGHAEALVPAIEHALSEAAVDYTALRRIGVTIGPGSFTGVRIALSTARALGLALQIPVIGITTLDAFAASIAQQTRPILVAIDARRGEVYLQVTSPEGEKLLAPLLAKPEDILFRLPSQPLIAIGTGAAFFVEARANITALPCDSIPQIVAIARLACMADPALHLPTPLYLRKPDAKPHTPILATPP